MLLYFPPTQHHRVSFRNLTLYSYRNIVGSVFPSPGQTIATLQYNMSQHCWAQHVACVWPLCCNVWQHSFLVLKIELVRTPGRSIVVWAWPGDYNIMQHPQMSHENFDHFQIWANNTQHVSTHCNKVAKPNNVAIFCVECCDRLARAWCKPVEWCGVLL